MYHLCKRIIDQLNVIQKTYREKTELLETTLENEWKNFDFNASNLWTQKFNELSNDFEQKEKHYTNQKEFFSNELMRIQLDHEEVTRAMRLHLVKEKENLELDLRQYKAKILLDSDKLMYNYYVLQLQDGENVFILSEERRNLTRLQDNVIALSQKVKESKESSQRDVGNRKLVISKLIQAIDRLQGNMMVKTEINRNNVSKISKFTFITFFQDTILLLIKFYLCYLFFFPAVP